LFVGPVGTSGVGSAITGAHGTSDWLVSTISAPGGLLSLHSAAMRSVRIPQGL
jgi:hypothetical protein